MDTYGGICPLCGREFINCICNNEESQTKSSDDILEIVIKIVNDHSGGVKFLELITDMTTKYRENFQPICDNFADRVEEIIRASDKVKILDYTYQALNRAKMFIYTP